MKENQFLNKKVKVINVKNECTGKLTTVVGTCSFIGKNKLLHKDQITVDRMPIFLHNFNQVSLF